ncbi:MAG: hypothetical protein JKX70_02285 [Phycisphaerales bacterium]|nr:hypothetical protein [Phycisphaerales bacterium]
MITEINGVGSKYTKTTYDPIGVIAQLAVCMVLVFFVRRVGKLLKIKIGQGKRGRWVLFLVLLVGTGLYGGLNPIDYGTVNLGGIVRSQTGEYSLEEIRGAIDNPDAMSVLIDSIAQQLDEASESDGILLSARVDHGYVSYTENWLGSLGRYIPLVKFSKQTYYEREPVNKQWRIDPPAHLRNEPKLDMSGLYWWEVRLGGANSLYWLSFSPGYVCLVLVGLYWLWRMLHLIGRSALGRMQRRRVGRDQCALCAYPLSEDGLVARRE